MLKIGITGHRPQRIAGYEKEIEDWIRNILGDYDYFYSKNQIIAYSGMASGTDQIFAKVAEDMGIPLVCCYAYPHKNYHPEQVAINERAISVQNISNKRSDDVWTIRDRYIVDKCDVMLAVFDGIEVGGVWDTIQYAKQVGKPIIYCSCFEKL